MRQDDHLKRRKRRADFRGQLEELDQAFAAEELAAETKPQTRAKTAQAQEYKDPPLLSWLLRGLKGQTFSIKNIHIRYEDCSFSPQKPYSFGFTIREIKLDNDEAAEKRERVANPSTVVKVQSVQGISAYVNSSSESFIPHGVLRAVEAENPKYGIFDMVPAEQLLEFMRDVFAQPTRTEPPKRPSN